MKERISIRDILSSESVALRASADSLFEHLLLLAKNKREIDLDFSDVRFISRSFTHSFLQHLEQLESVSNVELSNMSENIQEMIALVKETRSSSYLRRCREDLLPSNLPASLNRDFLDVD